MQRATSSQTGLSGIGLMIIGLVVAGLATLLMFTLGGSFQPAPSGGSDFVPTQDGLFWATFGLVGVGFVLIVAGVVRQIVARGGSKGY